jgi:hypothetical protein
MRKHIILLSLLLFSMCTPQKSRLYMVEEKQAEQSKTGVRNDTVFMDLTFGMTQRQTWTKFRELAFDSIIIIRSSGVFEYQMNMDSAKVRVGFHTSFLHDSLYSFSMILKGKNQSEADRLQLKMVDLLTVKYGNPVTVPSTSDKSKLDYYFVKGNLQIELMYPFSSNKTVVTYSDYSMEKRKNIEDQLLKKETKSKAH